MCSTGQVTEVIGRADELGDLLAREEGKTPAGGAR